MLAERTPASFVGFDLLAIGDDDLMGEPFSDVVARWSRALAEPRTRCS
jgi:ATP-dependent DNA ligase